MVYKNIYIYIYLDREWKRNVEKRRRVRRTFLKAIQIGVSKKTISAEILSIKLDELIRHLRYLQVRFCHDVLFLLWLDWIS